MPEFYIKYCEEGHCIYSAEGPITQKHCSRCGKSLLSECSNCGHRMSYVINSYVRAFESKPSSLPNRPNYCRNCGTKHPWTVAEIENLATIGIWGILHPAISDVSRIKFEDGHYSDAVESAVKFIVKEVGMNYKRISGDERDGVDLMRKAFGSANPAIVLDNMTTSTGTNIQDGYMNLFVGMVSALRNPLAHENIVVTVDQATHDLFLCSLLYNKFVLGRARNNDTNQKIAP